MKQKIISLLTLLVMSLGIYAQDIAFYTDQVLKAEPGGELTLTLNMRNSIPICGWDFRLYLPDGVSVVTELDEYDEPVYGISLSKRQAAADQAPETEICADGSLLIISTSAKKNFKENDGEMVSIKLKVDENITVGTKSIGIRNISFADLDVKSYSQDDFEIPLTIFSICNVSAKPANEAMGSVTIVGGGEAVESGSKVTVTATPATGYEFLNWAVGETVVSTENPYSFTVAKDAALVANFRIKKFNVSFDVDGQVTTESLEFGSVITAPTNIKKEGHTFAGWEPEFVEGTTVPANDLNYKAKWTVNQYTITFDTDGGTEIAPITQDFGTPITAPVEPSKTGYTFMGWSEDIPVTMPAGNKVFKAKWQINSYKVAFVSDGVEVSAKELVYGSVITAPTKIEKEGHTFSGWEPEFKEGATVPADNVTYTAKWTVNQYTITFDTDGGTEIAPITQDFGTTITAPDAPTKTGYSFVAWSEEIPATMPAQNLKLTATWQINSYNVVFVVDGEEISNVSQEYGSVIKAPDAPEKEGHTFSGWEPEFKEGTTVPADNVTYTAKWTVNQYTITFDTDGGTEIAPITQDFGTDITAPGEPTKTGYTFKGWSEEIPATMPAQNLKLTATWQINSYDVVFVVDGEEVSRVTQEYGTPITAPEVLDKVGHTFAGWDPEFKNGATVPADNVTYTAKWTVNKYTITFDTDGGIEMAPITQDFGSAITVPGEPTKEGHTFMGWDKEIPATMPAENITIKASWKINSYKVIFVVDGVEVSNVTQEYGTVITAPADPVKTGHEFAGWSPQFKEGATVPGKDITYTAIWSTNKYTITFDTDGGTEIASITQSYGTEVTRPADPVKTGYTFMGWSEEVPATMPATDMNIKAIWQINSYKVVFVVDGVEVSNVTQEYGTVITAPKAPEKEGHTFVGWNPEFKEGTTVPADNVTYTAMWTVNKYTITFDTDGGSEIAPITQDYGTNITAPAAPLKEGHTFTGWDKEIPATMPATDMNIKATWQINSYDVVFVVDGEEVSRVTQEYGTPITAPAEPVKDGYIFDGWDPEFVEGATVPEGGVTYTAQWLSEEYVITFDSNGGSYVAPIVQRAGTPIVAPADPKREYYIFKGWSQEIPEVMPKENLTLVAQWEIDTKLVKVDMGLFLSGVDIVDIPEADEVIMQEVPYDYDQIVKAYEEARAAHRSIGGEALYAAYLKAQKDLTAYMDYCYENGNLKVYEYTLGESWGTLILPFQYEAPEGWTFYSVSAMLEEGDNLLRLDVAESISANTPYLVNGPVGKKIQFVGHVKSDVKNVTDGMLTGVQSDDYTPQPGDYVLQTNEDGTGFYRVEDASQAQAVGVARCYLTLPADMEQFDVVYVERLTTSIDGVASQDEDAPIFNVAGQRKAKLSRGINIVGGKIIICK